MLKLVKDGSDNAVPGRWAGSRLAINNPLPVNPWHAGIQHPVGLFETSLLRLLAAFSDVTSLDPSQTVREEHMLSPLLQLSESNC